LTVNREKRRARGAGGVVGALPAAAAVGGGAELTMAWPRERDASIRTETGDDRSRHRVSCELVVVFVVVDALRPFRFVACPQHASYVTVARSSGDPQNGVQATTTVFIIWTGNVHFAALL